MTIFFVYIDWMLEKQARPFYVGKGTQKRLYKRKRNVYWQNIAAKYGWRREVVLATKDESFAFEEEKRRIAELGTFEDGTPGRWGANLTEGGEGPSGAIVSEQTRIRLRAKVMSPEERERISKALQGHPVDAETRAKISRARRGMKFTPEHCANIRKAVTGRKNPCSESRRALIRQTRYAQSPVTKEIAQAIRDADGTQREIATRFNVSQSTVHNIRAGKRWNES